MGCQDRVVGLNDCGGNLVSMLLNLFSPSLMLQMNNERSIVLAYKIFAGKTNMTILVVEQLEGIRLR
jgi:hypothetical protein